MRFIMTPELYQPDFAPMKTVQAPGWYLNKQGEGHALPQF